MIIKLEDLREDRWYSIRHDICAGRRPSKRRTVAALRRGEAKVPAEAQRYIAELLETPPSNPKRGRRPKSAHDKWWEAAVLHDRVDRWSRVFKLRFKVNNWRERAFQQVAIERKWEDETVRQRFIAAKTLLRQSQLPPLSDDAD